MILLKLWTLSFLAVQVWDVCVGEEACENTLSEDNPVMVRDTTGKLIELTRCVLMTRNYPDLCRGEHGDRGGVCCRACWHRDLNCIDSDLKDASWTVDGKEIGCAEYINGDWSKCQANVFTAHFCCKSCQEAFECRDIVSEVNRVTLTVKGEKVYVTSCADLVNNYLSLCKGLYGQKHGSCCDSCRDQNLTCIDNSLIYWTVNKQKYNCAEYVAKDPCHCENQHVKDNCCHSCQGQVCEACRDYLSEDTTIQVTTVKGVRKSLTSCAELTSDFLSLCKDEPGQQGGHCCKACSQHDLSCVDNALYRFIVRGVPQGCAEYVAGDPCRCEEVYTASNCCASCQDKVCERCRDTLGDKEYIDVLDRDDNLVERLRDCRVLTQNYLYLCKWWHGQEGGACCHSCSKQDLTCIDDGTFGYPIGNKILKCPEYVASNPEKCQTDNKTKELCCASCADQASCMDDPDFKTTIKLKVKTETGKVKVKCNKCSCLDIHARGKPFVKKACKNKKKQVAEFCCALCQPYAG